MAGYEISALSEPGVIKPTVCMFLFRHNITEIETIPELESLVAG